MLSCHSTAQREMLLLGVNTEEEAEGVERELLAATASCVSCRAGGAVRRCNARRGAAALSLFPRLFFLSFFFA